MIISTGADCAGTTFTAGGGGTDWFLFAAGNHRMPSAAGGGSDPELQAGIVA